MSSPTFYPNPPIFYTYISAIYVTFCNSAGVTVVKNLCYSQHYWFALHRLLKANCLYCNLLEFDGVVLLNNTKGWAVGSPEEEKLLMAENLKEKLKILKETSF